MAAAQRGRFGLPSSLQLAQLAVPTLVVNGSEDLLVGDPASVANEIPGAELVIVPGDHLSAVVKPQFAGAVARFLESLADRGVQRR